MGNAWDSQDFEAIALVKLKTQGRYVRNDVIVSCKFNERSMVTQLSNVEPSPIREGAETIISHLSSLEYGEGIVQ